MARDKNKNPYDIVSMLDQSARLKAAVKLQPVRDAQILFDEFISAQAKSAKNTTKFMTTTIEGSIQAEMAYPAEQREKDKETIAALAAKPTLSPEDSAKKAELEEKLADFANGFSDEYNARMLKLISRQRKAALDAILGQ